MIASAAKALDAALEVSVAGSFSRLGIAARRRLFGWDSLPPDMTGRVVLLTGASSGIGRAAALQLARLGAELVLVGRDAERLAAVELGCIDAGAPAVRTIRCDLTLLSEARRLVDQMKESHDRLDVLIHNAGALVHDYRQTSEGFEQTFAAQVLSQHVITCGLLPLLSTTPDSRVIVVSSGGMYAERLVADQVEYDAEHYDGVRAYARAKRAQVALNEEWAVRTPGAQPVFHAMHPGWADTPGVAASLPGFRRVTGPFLRTPEEGADTIVWLATAPEAAESSGRFWLDRAPRSTVKVPWTNPEDGEAGRLWDLVCRLTGELPRTSA
ncbi:MAG: hypothetical protein RLZ55_1709 [Actinomycetota bacterium]